MSDDATLLSRYAAHQDAEAFSEIVRRHAGLVHGTCRRICGNAASADDAAQECFLQLARHAGQINSSLPAWLHTVAIRAAVRLRGNQRNASLDAVSEPATPELETWRRLAPLLDEALARLPEDQRVAIALRYLEGRSQAEISTMLGISQPTVSRRLESGLTSLRLRFSEHLGVVGLPQVLDQALWQPPSHVIASAGRIAIAGITPLPTAGAISFVSWSLAVTLLAIVGFVGWWGQTRPSPSQQPPSAAAAVEPPPVLVAASSVLDRPITCNMRGWQLDTAVDVLLDQLPVQFGERIEVMPAAAGMPRVTLACDATPLHVALDQLVKDTGWRWRTLGSVVYLDQSTPRDERVKLLMAVAAAVPAEREAAARSLVGHGDLDACGELLALLAEKRWDDLGARDPNAVHALDLAVFHALADVGATWQDWLPRGNPLGLLAGNEAAKSGVVAAWKRCLLLRRPVSPYLCYLVGELRIRELADDLLRLVREPGVLLPGLDATQPCQAQVIGRTRQWAIYAIGRMGYVEAGHELATRLAHSMRDPDALALLTTLGALGNREALPILAGIPTEGSGDWFRGTTLYVATARLDSTKVLALVGRGGLVKRGSWDGFVGYPAVDLLPQVMSASASNRWWEQQAFWKGTGRIQATLVAAAASSARENAKTSAAQCALDTLLVRGGDEVALDRLAHAVNDERNALPMELAVQCAARLSPARGKALAERLVASIDLRHASDGALGLLMAMPPTDWEDRLVAAWSTADPQAQAAMVHILARSGSPAGQRYLLDRLLGADGPRIVGALDSRDFNDPALRRQLVSLLPRLDLEVAKDLASSELINYRDSALPTAAFLITLSPATVDQRLVQRLRVQFNYDGSVRNSARPLHAVLQFWAQESTFMTAVRIKSIDCLEWFLYRDLRSHRLTVISALTTLALKESDSQIRDKAVEALKIFLGETDVPDGMEPFTQASIMAGSLDDLVGVRALEQARPAAQRAIAEPGAEVPTHEVTNF